MFLDYRTAWKSNTIFSQNYLDDAFASKKYHMSRPLFLASRCRNPSSRKALIRAIFHSKSFRKFCPLCSTPCTKVVEHQIFHCPEIENDRDRFLTTLSPGSWQLFNPEDFPTLFKTTCFENLGKFLQVVKFWTRSTLNRPCRTEPNYREEEEEDWLTKRDEDPPTITPEMLHYELSYKYQLLDHTPLLPQC